MKTQTRDLLVLIDESDQAREALDSLIFLPPLRVRQTAALPDPESNREEPLVYLIGQVPELSGGEALVEWLDRLQEAEGAPAALLLPRDGYEWCAAAGHPQFCGLLPHYPQIPIDAMEHILRFARRTLAGRWGEHAVRRADLAWSFTSSEAADTEQVWLLVESSLNGLIGARMDLSCLGMAFTEALTNAVEHGNLELESSLKDKTDDGLFRFFEEREERLKDPRYGRRRVRITAEVRGDRLTLRIRNEGLGFDPRILAHRSEETASRPVSFGMGLAMIQSLVDEVGLSEDGRTISLKQRLSRRGHRIRGLNPGILNQGGGESRAA